MRRFPTVGHFASYCRCSGSEHLSNGKRKGAGNTKNGNKYLSWAFIEAAHCAIRYEAVIRGFYQRKHARAHSLVALKAVAHKLARACYHVLARAGPVRICTAPSARVDRPGVGLRSSLKGVGGRPRHSRLSPAVCPPRFFSLASGRGLRRLDHEPSKGLAPNRQPDILCLSIGWTRPGTDSCLGHTECQGPEWSPDEGTLSRP